MLKVYSEGAKVNINDIKSGEDYPWLKEVIKMSFKFRSRKGMGSKVKVKRVGRRLLQQGEIREII